MNFPPMIMKLIISPQGKRGINLWLPLFIIFPIVFVIGFILFLLLLPIMLIASVILWRFGWVKLSILSFPAVIGCLSALRGLKMDVNQGRERVLISFS